MDYSWIILWEQEKRQNMAYTRGWQSLISHGNKPWLDDIKDGAIEVHCVSEYEQGALFVFCLKECVCKDKSSKQHAVDLYKT